MSDGINPALPTAAEASFRSLIRTYGLVRRFMEPYFALHGISGSQWGVLRAIQRAEKEGAGGLRLTDLGERLLVRPPSVTGVVDRLQRLGLVVREASTTDLRAKHVSLTDAGRRLVNVAREGQLARIKAVMNVLSEREQGELLGALDKIAERLEALAEGAQQPTTRGQGQAESGEGKV